MSKKNLSRTVIEGGRYKRNKTERYESHAEQRAQEKNYIQDISHDMENWYDHDIAPIRPVRKEFKDKLGPMYQWLRHQVDRPWDEVLSDVVKTFDTRTTAGRHIVYGHLISSVEVTPDVQYNYRSVPGDPNASYYYNDFYVDEGGILRLKRYVNRNRDKKIPDWDTNQLANWLSGRVVGKMGNKYFWFVPVGKGKKHHGYTHTWRTAWGRYGSGYWNYQTGLHFEYLTYEIIYKKDSVGQYILSEDGKQIELERKPKWVASTPNALRQDRKLNDKEMKYWNSIPEYFRTKVLEQSPGYPLPIQQRKYY